MAQPEAEAGTEPARFSELVRLAGKPYCTTSPADGAVPAAGLIQDALGNLFGTTATGGAYGYGAVFKLAADGTETVLYSFCGDPDCVDGNQPSFASLVRDRAGNMYGVAGLGADQAGVVFKLTP